MLKEIEKTRQYFKNSKNLFSFTPIKLKKNKSNINDIIQTNKICGKNFLKINGKIKFKKIINPLNKVFMRKLKNDLTKKIKKEKNELKLLNDKDKDKDKKDININMSYNLISPNNKNPANYKQNQFLLINNSSSNIFNSTTETSLNLNNHNIFKKVIPSKTKINKNKNNIYKRNNNNIISNNRFCSSINNLILEDKSKDGKNRKSVTHLKDIRSIINSKENCHTIKMNNISKNEEIPNLMISIKKIKDEFIIPLRNEYKVKNTNSFYIKNKILKLRNNIFENNKELDIKQKNKSFINLNSKKHLSILLIQKAQSLFNINEINELKNDINLIKDEIKKNKEKTILYKEKYLNIFNEIDKYKNEINKKEKEMNEFLEIKNNVKTMIVLLHKRIIDVKERIKQLEAKKENINKSWYELSLKYNKIETNKIK